MANDTGIWFAKAANLRKQYPHGDVLAAHTSALTEPAETDTPTIAAVKLAASLMDVIKMVGRSADSHMLGSALYAPLVASDFMEARHQRRAGRSGMIPALAGGALAVMMAQHLAPMLEHGIKSPRAQQILARLGVGKK